MLGGVLERFPELMIVAAESEIGWLPHWMQRMDHANMKFGAMMETKLSMEPSEYVRRQIWLTFMDDAVGAASYEIIGQDSFMWGSDFPHTDSTWPNGTVTRELAAARCRRAEHPVDNAASAPTSTLSGPRFPTFGSQKGR